MHPVGVEIPPRSTPEKDAPPDPRSEEQGDYDERQEDLEAPAAADLTESNKPELVDKKPLQSEAAHTKSTIVLSTKIDDSAENTAIQIDRSKSGLSLAHEVTFGGDMSQVHGTASGKNLSQYYGESSTASGSSNVPTLPPLYLPPIPPLSSPHFAATRMGSSESEPLPAYQIATASLKDWSRHYTKNPTTSGSFKIPPLSPNHRLRPSTLSKFSSYNYVTNSSPEDRAAHSKFKPVLDSQPYDLAEYRPHSNARSRFGERDRNSIPELPLAYGAMFKEDVSSASKIAIYRDRSQYYMKNSTTSGSSKVPPLLPLDPRSPPSPSGEVTPSPVLSPFFSYGATDTFESQDASLEGQAGPLFSLLDLDPIPPLSGPHLGATNSIKSTNSSLEDGTAHSEFNFDSQSHDSAENAATQMGSSGPGLLPVHEATFEEDVSRTPGSVSYRDLPQDYVDAHTEH